MHSGWKSPLSYAPLHERTRYLHHYQTKTALEFVIRAAAYCSYRLQHNIIRNDRYARSTVATSSLPCGFSSAYVPCLRLRAVLPGALPCAWMPVLGGSCPGSSVWMRGRLGHSWAVMARPWRSCRTAPNASMMPIAMTPVEMPPPRPWLAANEPTRAGPNPAMPRPTE
jgi:hypothetical protein